MNFVLVHGGWHGAWCWETVARILRNAGHEVRTPTLTGLGERADLLDPGVGLDTHVRDVAEVLVDEDSRDVVLVGHSYAGMVISGVADREPHRLRGLVFLDAFVPEDGQSLFDLLRPERREFYRKGAEERGEGWRVPPPPPQALGVSDEGEARLLASRLTPQPIRTFEQPVRLADPSAKALPRTYVHCTLGPLAPSFAPFAARFREEPGWGYQEISTGHDAMLTVPGALCKILVQIGQDEGRKA